MYYLEDLLAARGELVDRIGELGDERRRFVADHMKARGVTNDRSFDSVVRGTIRQEAEALGLSFRGN